MTTALPIDWVNQYTNESIMFTILQARNLGNFNVFEAIAHATSIEQASELCADLCNAAGVVRTIAVDELGSVVCVES